ncbi:hypothetical protein ABIE27_002614, partial [Paenibacillus sp. 4624]
FRDPYSKVEQVKFADGTIWTQSQLESKVITEVTVKNRALLKSDSLNDGKKVPDLAAVSTQTEQLIQAMSTFSATSDMELSQSESGKRYAELPMLAQSWTKI